MSSPESERRPSDESLAKAFVAAGLESSFSVPDRIRAAMDNAELVAWRRERHPAYWAYGLTSDATPPDLSEWSAATSARTWKDTQQSGLRLVAPLARYRLGARGAAEIQRILEHPGYEAAARTSGITSGLASFVFDSSFIPGAWKQPALSWPLRVMVGTDVLASALEHSSVVQRGFVRLVPLEKRAEGARVLVETTGLTESRWHGPVLALRFFSRGSPTPLPAQLGLNPLLDIEPVVFLPLRSLDDSERALAEFVYGLSHNLPVDVAAWDASRRFLARPPLIVAPRGFFLRARISDTIPVLQARLLNLVAQGSPLALAEQDLRRLGPEPSQSAPREGSATGLARLLGQLDLLNWSRESDAATGLVAVVAAVEEAERHQGFFDQSKPSPPSPPLRPSADLTPLPRPPPPPAATPVRPSDEQLSPFPQTWERSAPANSPDWYHVEKETPRAYHVEEQGASAVEDATEGDEGSPQTGSYIAPPIIHEEPPAPAASPDSEPLETVSLEVELPDFGSLVLDASPVEIEQFSPIVVPHWDVLPSGIPDPLADTGTSVQPPQAQTANTAGPPPRYTDIKILDDEHGECSDLEPLLVDRFYTLDVSIKVLRDGLTKNRLDQPAVELPGQSETEHVWVVLTDETDGEPEIEGRLFRFDCQIAPLTVPPTGDSTGSAQFRFAARPGRRLRLDRPREEVCPRIGIRLYYKLNLVDHVQLELRFEHGPGGLPSSVDSPAIRVSFKHPGKSPIEALSPTSATRTLTISISKPDESATAYRFAFAAGLRNEPDKPALTGTRKLSVEELDGFVAEFRDILLGTVFGRSLEQVELRVPDRDELLTSLARLGTRIVTRLFDLGHGGDFSELGAMLRDALPGVAIIQVSLSGDAEDFVFPWQILTLAPYLDQELPPDPLNLWGYRFVLEVKRCGDGADSRPRRPQIARTSAAARVTYGRWNFKNEKEHYDYLQTLVKRANALLSDPIVESKDEFTAALLRGGGDLVYVYAHGHAAAPNTSLGIRYRNTARLKLETLRKQLDENPTALAAGALEDLRTLHEQFLKLTRTEAESSLTLTQSDVELTYLLETIAAARVRLTDAPIVFLNTCESAQVWNAVDGSFVGFFLDRGARAVLGTECTIPIVLADAFGRVALESLFAGSSLGEAVYKARWHLLQQHCNPLGLCYCLYGAADSRLLQ